MDNKLKHKKLISLERSYFLITSSTKSSDKDKIVSVSIKKAKKRQDTRSNHQIIDFSGKVYGGIKPHNTHTF